MTWDWPRLAAAIKGRRDELGLTQKGLADETGVTSTTIRNLEGGRTFSRLPPSVRPMEMALGWAPGSVRAILEGGSPTPTATEGPSAGTPGDVDDSRFVRTPMGTYDLIQDLLRGIVGAVAPDTSYSKFLEAEEKAIEIAERHGFVVRSGHTGEQRDKPSSGEDTNRT
jgi:transcriptional regulator with XRE-family HTH domain